MPWMLDPSYALFGAHFPDTDFIGWDEAVPDIHDQVSAIHVWRKGGTFVDEQLVPRKAKLVKNYKRLGDIFTPGSQLIMVQQPLKDLLEELEPGVHQFWPIELLLKNGEPFETSCYGMVPGHSLSTIDLERSDAEEEDNQAIRLGRDLERSKKEKTLYKIVIKESARKGAHFWYEQRLIKFSYMISDQLRDAIKVRKLKFVKCYPVDAL